MTLPRKQLVNLSDTPYYHVVSRCVRRTYLCGYDSKTDKDYEHRRQWIENRIRLLSSIFAIDICAYAVMSNHLHIVVKVTPEELDTLTDFEIARRWACLYKGSILFQKWLEGKHLDQTELDAVLESVQVYRNRLQDLGWFMKCLNEPIARQANKEDGCTGHFWQSRYKSQALHTKEALLTCMAYIDLNPVRAEMNETPETSAYTSIKERVQPSFNLANAVAEQIHLEALQQFDLTLKPLLPFETGLVISEQKGILLSFEDYLTLVDTTGRCIRENKCGTISTALPPLLERVNIDPEAWLNNVANFEKHYQSKFSKRVQNFKKTA